MFAAFPAFPAFRRFPRPPGANESGLQPLDDFPLGYSAECRNAMADDDECRIEREDYDKSGRKLPIVEVAVASHAEQEHDDEGESR